MKKEIKIILLITLFLSLFIGLDVYAATANCNSVFGNNSETTVFLGYVLSAVRWGVPVVIIIMSSIDFAKAVTAGDDKAINTAGKRLIMRLVIGLTIFLLPNILNMVLSLIDSSTCGL